MNPSFDTAPTTLESQSTLSFEDIAPLLRIPSSYGGNNETPASASSCFDKENEAVPSNFDILLGRDKLSHSHPGNKRFRVVVAMNRERYQNCTSRDGKTCITGEVIASIKECGGRFLRKNNTTGLYEAVGNDVIHEKVSHALRSAKDPKKKAPRKKKKVVRKAPSPEENKTFHSLFQEQNKIFQQLLLEHSTVESANDMRNETWQSEVLVGV
jgi:hypothetical protein